MARGRLITIEGGEGTGKSTQSALLGEGLESAALGVVVTREPGGSAGAEQIRRLLVEGNVERWSPLAEAMLHYAARVDHVETTIMPAIESGRWVVCDRFADSTMAYQGYGHRLGAERIGRLHDVVLGGFRPDLTIVLDVPVDVGLARAKARRSTGTAPEDRYERMEVGFHQRLREGFLTIARMDPDRCAVVDATGDIARVQDWIRTLVHNRLGTAIP